MLEPSYLVATMAIALIGTGLLGRAIHRKGYSALHQVWV